MNLNTEKSCQVMSLNCTQQDLCLPTQPVWDLLCQISEMKDKHEVRLSLDRAFAFFYLLRFATLRPLVWEVTVTNTTKCQLFRVTFGKKDVLCEVVINPDLVNCSLTFTSVTLTYPYPVDLQHLFVSSFNVSQWDPHFPCVVVYMNLLPSCPFSLYL